MREPIHDPKDAREILKSQGAEALRQAMAEVEPFADGVSLAADSGNPEDSPSRYPVHCLPPKLRAIVEGVSRVTISQNMPLAGGVALAIVSASLGAGLQIGTGGERRTRGNIFMFIIAESGSGKGETFKLVGKPFEKADAEHRDHFVEHILPGLRAGLEVAEEVAKKELTAVVKAPDQLSRRFAEEALAITKKKIAAIQLQISAEPCLKVGDITKEALAVKMASQAGEAIFSASDEARGMVYVLGGKYSKKGGDEDIFCSGYSGDSIRVDRIHRESVRLDQPCLSLCWLVQPDVATMVLADSALMESGLVPRLLMFDPKAEPQVRATPPAPIPDAVKADWNELIRSLVAAYRKGGDEPRTIDPSSEAFAIFNDYENENIRRRQKTGDLRDLASFAARWTENAWKLALILHAARYGDDAHSRDLDAATARHGIELTRWHAREQLELLATGRRERLSNRLSKLLQVLQSANGEISIRDLKNSHSFTEEEINQLHSHFPGSFRIEERKPSTGRPSRWVCLPQPDSKI